MHIRTFTAGSELEPWLVSCHQLALAARQHDHPGEPLFALEDTRFDLTHAQAGGERRFLLAIAPDQTVLGWGELTLTHDDNQHLAEIALLVHPAERGKGVGTRLLEQAQQLAREHGRTTITGTAFEAAPGFAWGMRRDFTPALKIARQRLELATVDHNRLKQPATADYRVVHFTDEVPAQWRASYGAAKAQIHDAPLGTVPLEKRYWTSQQLEEWLAFNRAGRQLELIAVIHEPTQTIAGITELLISRWSPYRAWQNDTVVARAHRGHGLGRIMKAEQLRWVRTERPDIAEIITWNAADNPYMLNINAYFGFQVLDYTQEMTAQL